jgi:hypothetical protein
MKIRNKIDLNTIKGLDITKNLDTTKDQGPHPIKATVFRTKSSKGIKDGRKNNSGKINLIRLISHGI